MIETIQLVHCHPVKIHGEPPPVQDLEITLSVGGSAGDGSVAISALPGSPGGFTVVTGDSKTYDLPQTLEVWLHYSQEPGGPDVIDVSYELGPPTNA